MIAAPAVRLPRARRAFALPDLAALLLIGAVIVGVLAAAAHNQRRLARLGEDIAHLKEIGAGTFQYQGDNADLFCTFSWHLGEIYQTEFPDLNVAFDEVDACANQLVYLLRTRGGLTATQMPRVLGVIPHPYYTTVVLADYLDQSLPWLPAVSSGDAFRLRWATDRQCFETHCVQCQPWPQNGGMRWPFSASFQPSVCLYDRSPVGHRISQNAEPYNAYIVNYPTVGGVVMADVAHPSQKVMYAPQNAWHFGSRRPFCTHEEARITLLMADGSATVRAAGEANLGWDPNNPNSQTAVTTISYSPAFSGLCWDPPQINPTGDFVPGRFRFTRNGIAGRDFGGPEVP